MRSVRLLTVIIGCMAGAWIAGCTGDSPVNPQDGKQETVLSPETHVITGRDGLSLYEIDGARYIFTIGGAYPAFHEGDIIVGWQKGGYVRRIEGARLAGGRLIIDTRGSDLAHAVKHGSIDTVVNVGFGSASVAFEAGEGEDPPAPASFAPGVTADGGGILLSDLVLHAGSDQRQATVFIENGRVRFNPDILFDFQITVNRINKIHMAVNGVLEFDCDALVVVDADTELSGELLIATVTRRAILYMGPVPVVADITYALSAGFEVSSPKTSEYRTGVNGSQDLTFGAEYKGGAWSPVDLINDEYEPHPFEYISQGGTEFRMVFKPSFNIVFYSIDGVEIELGSYYSFTGSMHDLGVLEWEFSGGYTGGFDLSAAALDKRLPAVSMPPLNHNVVIDSGPFRTADFIFVTEWGVQGSGEGQFDTPEGIAFDPAGNVCITDTRNHRIKKFSAGGLWQSMWGIQGLGDGQLYFPARIAVTPEDTFYIVDDGHRVQKYGPDGTFIRSWGSEGDGDGQFGTPRGIAVDSEGYVYVADMMHHRIQKFTPDGGFVRKWGSFGIADGELGGPVGIAIDSDGYLYVTECSNRRVSKFDQDGGFIMSWGGYGTDDGQFDCPMDAAVDADGNIYIADYGNDRIQKFAPDGTFLTKLGSSGTEAGRFDRPVGIAVEGSGNLYIVDSRNHRIQKFAPIIQGD